MKILIILFVLIATIASKYFILDRSRPLTLQYSSFYGAVAATLLSSHAGTYQPIEGKDYTLSKPAYFDNKQWLVLHMSPVGTFSDPGIIVLKKNGAFYQTILGPTNDSFTSYQLSGFPSDLTRYLTGGSQ